jgi:DNA-binding MarR family transcriptional regulator
MTTRAITLAQIDQVVRRSSKSAGISSSLRRLSEGNLVSSFSELASSSRLSRSLLLGLTVLACFPSDGRALSVAEVAEELSLSPSTTHRYMTTLLSVGLLEQYPRSRRYRLPAPE